MGWEKTPKISQQHTTLEVFLKRTFEIAAIHRAWGQLTHRGRNGHRSNVGFCKILKPNSRLAAAIVACLDWWAGHRRVGTVHAAVARYRFQNRLAALAVIEPLTDIGRHGLNFDMPAFGTCYRRLKDYWVLLRFHKAYPVMTKKIASAGRRTISR